MVDQAVPRLSVAEAKARLLAADAPREGGLSLPRSWVLPAAGAALFVGILLSRRRRRGFGFWGLSALALNPTLRSAAVAFAVSAVRRFMAPPPR